MSKNLNIELLGKIPIEIGLREGADNGKPYVEFFNDSKIAGVIIEIAKKISEKIK
jgi:ATP-binding protein involved in chromosome partitioning